MIPPPSTEKLPTAGYVTVNDVNSEVVYGDKPASTARPNLTVTSFDDVFVYVPGVAAM